MIIQALAVVLFDNQNNINRHLTWVNKGHESVNMITNALHLLYFFLNVRVYNINVYMYVQCPFAIIVAAMCVILCECVDDLFAIVDHFSGPLYKIAGFTQNLHYDYFINPMNIMLKNQAECPGVKRTRPAMWLVCHKYK